MTRPVNFQNSLAKELSLVQNFEIHWSMRFFFGGGVFFDWVQSTFLHPIAANSKCLQGQVKNEVILVRAQLL